MWKHSITKIHKQYHFKKKLKVIISRYIEIKLQYCGSMFTTFLFFLPLMKLILMHKTA